MEMRTLFLLVFKMTELRLMNLNRSEIDTFDSPFAVWFSFTLHIIKQTKKLYLLMKVLSFGKMK